MIKFEVECVPIMDEEKIVLKATEPCNIFCGVHIRMSRAEACELRKKLDEALTPPHRLPVTRSYHDYPP